MASAVLARRIGPRGTPNTVRGEAIGTWKDPSAREPYPIEKRESQDRTHPRVVRTPNANPNL